jgi:hypothetical protein
LGRECASRLCRSWCQHSRSYLGKIRSGDRTVVLVVIILVIVILQLT